MIPSFVFQMSLTIFQNTHLKPKYLDFLRTKYLGKSEELPLIFPKTKEFEGIKEYFVGKL
jgi:hypothetical protein